MAQSCTALCDSIDCSTPGLPVHHQLLEFTQTHVHWVGDAIQPAHPLTSPSPLTFNLSQHQGLLKWVSFLHQVVKVLEFQLQHQSFQWILRMISFRMDWLDPLAVQGTERQGFFLHPYRALARKMDEGESTSRTLTRGRLESGGIDGSLSCKGCWVADKMPCTVLCLSK